MSHHVVELERTSTATPDVVWRWLADAASWKEWTRLTDTRLEREGAPEPDGVGAIRRFARSGGSSLEEVVVFDPPRHLAYVLVRGLPIVNYRADVTLEPVDGGTRDPVAQRVRHLVSGHRARRCACSSGHSSATPRAGSPSVPSAVPRCPLDSGRTAPVDTLRPVREVRGDMGMRTRRWVVALTATVVVLAGCRIPGQWFPGHGPAQPSGVRVVAPANRTQAPTSGEVPLDVRLDVEPRRVLAAGVDRRGRGRTRPPPPRSPAGSTRDATGATATLHAADLQPGLLTIKATAAPKTGRPGPRRGTRSFSWEPAVDHGHREPVRSDRGAQVPDAVPERLLHRAPMPTAAPVGACTSTARRCRRTPSGVHDRPDRVEPQRRLQPGCDDRHLRPRARSRDDGCRADHRHRRVAARRPADRAARHRHRAALAVLVAELDSQADPADAQALVVRSAKNLPEGHRYIVAMRDLRDGNGALDPGRTRASSSTATASRPSRPRSRPGGRHFEQIFADPRARRDRPRANLYLAWDFTVASEQNLAGRMLHIRDDAFASLHGAAPSFTVTEVENNVDDQISRRVTGTFTVPNYLTGDGSPGNRFDYAPGAGPDALPVRNGNFTAGFICNIPRSATRRRQRPRAPPRVAVSTVTACSGATTRSTPATSAR